jgi:outer membrane receptor protein involved in Fe transport
MAGSNFHDNQINVGLYPRQGRVPLGVATRGLAHVTNTAGYTQESVDLLRGHLHMEGGIRWDYFQFQLNDEIVPVNSGTLGAARWQPKAALAYTPAARIPLTLYFNYGRGISSQDARGVVQKPASPRLATTDFYQFGNAHHLKRFSLSTDLFLIDRSNEQVYMPDDGSLEFKGPSRAYGFEAKTSVELTRHLTLNGGLTQVTHSFYRATFPRLYVDSAPHSVGNAALTLAGWLSLYGSLRYRHIGNYRLDGFNPAIRASGLDVLDLSLAKQLRRWVDLNLAVDNMADKRYYETQNYFDSRLRPLDPVVSRVHGTPGYPIGVTLGVTFHLSSKQ